MRAKLLALGAALGAFALGLAAGAEWQGSARPEGGTRAMRPGEAGGTGGPEATASETERAEEGARAAAIAFATASQDWLYLPDEEIDRSVRAVATPTAASSLSREAVSELGAARDALAKSPGRAWWLVRPLASRVEHFAPTRARIGVWTVTVLSAPDVALPQADWVRVTVDLAWAEGAWRVDAVTEAPGPTPVTGSKDRPWSPEALEAALAGFERVRLERPS